MKKAIAVAVLALTAVCMAQDQDVAGDWQGTLENGMGELRIVLHITKAADGTLKATMDSPDQGVVGVPIDTIALTGSKLKFTANAVKGSYEGVVKTPASINGSWFQPKKVDLDFKKTTTPLKLDHPPAPASDIDGAWEGMLITPGATLHLVFHIKNTGDGLTATVDSPDQNMKGWPATSVTRKGSSIKIEMKQLSAAFSGKLNKELNNANGDWTQGDTSLPLQIKRAKAEPAEAQKPVGPATPAHK